MEVQEEVPEEIPQRRIMRAWVQQSPIRKQRKKTERESARESKSKRKWGLENRRQSFSEEGMRGGSIPCSPISSGTPPLALASPLSHLASISSANKSTIASMLILMLTRKPRTTTNLNYWIPPSLSLFHNKLCLHPCSRSLYKFQTMLPSLPLSMSCMATFYVFLHH